MMTTKELAEVLNVDVDTVNNAVKKLDFSEVLRKSIDTVRKMISEGKSRTYYYNDVAKNELMKKISR